MSLASRSFTPLSGIWGLLVSVSRGSGSGGPAGAPELACDRLQHHLAVAVSALIQLNGGQFGARGAGQAGRDVPGVEPAIALPGLVHANRGAGAILGARLGLLADERRLLGDVR